MYSKFYWTGECGRRNRLLRAIEPLQPYLLYCLAKEVGAEAFLDIGANIGAYSLFLSQVSSIKEIHAFEPTPEAFRVLNAVIAKNSLSAQVKAYQVAASDQNGTLDFCWKSNCFGGNAVLVTAFKRASSFSGVSKVRSESVDKLLRFENRRICIKIDVEGHELNVVYGARETLEKNSCVVQVEAFGENATRVASTFSDLGYEKISQIKNDMYFANRSQNLSDDDVRRSFEKSTEMLIDEQFEARSRARTKEE